MPRRCDFFNLFIRRTADARANYASYEKRVKNVQNEEQAKKLIELENRLAEEVAAAAIKPQIQKYKSYVHQQRLPKVEREKLCTELIGKLTTKSEAGG